MAVIEVIVHNSEPVTLVGGGPASVQDLQDALNVAPLCVAADGGAALVFAAGVELAAVIGDMDSTPPEVLSGIAPERQHHVAEQDSTDFEKSLRRIHAPVVLGVGFLGGRIDHELAALHLLAVLPDRPCVLLGPTEVVCLAPPELTLPTKPGDIVSLFPLAPVTGQSEGLDWPIDGLKFSPGRKIGTSNRASGPMRLRMNAPNMLLILPRRLMPALVAARAGAGAMQWPARTE